MNYLYDSRVAMAHISLLFLIAQSLLHLHIVSAATTNCCPSHQYELPDLIYLASPSSSCISGTDGTECDIFLRMAPNVDNESFVDFYMEGNLKGWVAVGFSQDKQIASADVVGCKQARDGSLGVINSWISASPGHNVIDPSQHYMCNYSVKYENGRLKCHFSRYFGIINQGYDYDLNGSYHLILGHGANQDSLNSAFSYHTVIPSVSQSKFNVFDYNDNTSNGTAPGLPTWTITLKKAHGIIMLFAWSVLASTGVFISSWMKPALVKGRWLQLHRGLTVTSVPTVLIGLICIFVSNKHIGVIIGFDCSLQTAHFSLGIIATILLLINPILALFRCKPTSSNRWIFDMVHGPIGGLAVVIGRLVYYFRFLYFCVNYTNFAIGTGLDYYQTGCDECSSKKAMMFFIYLVWQLGFVVLFQITLNIVFSVVAFNSQGKERFHLAPSFVKPCLKMPSHEEYTLINSEDDYDISKLSKDYLLRAVLFGVYTVVNCIVVLLLIVMLARKSPCGA